MREVFRPSSGAAAVTTTTSAEVYVTGSVAFAQRGPVASCSSTCSEIPQVRAEHVMTRSSTSTTSQSTGDTSRLNATEAPTPPPAPAITAFISSYAAARAVAASK